MQITYSQAAFPVDASSLSISRRRSPSTSSTASSNGHLAGLERKLKKPLMEKRRRARINRCLNELTQILLNENSPSSSSPTTIASDSQKTKMEKADILEMTVRYLKNKRTMDAQAARRHFVDGFQQCSAAVLDFVKTKGHGQGQTTIYGEAGNWQTILAERLNEKLAGSQNLPSPKMAPMPMVHRPEPQRLMVNMPYTPTTPNSVFTYTPIIALTPGHNRVHHQPAMLNPLSLPPTPPLGGCPMAGGDQSSRFFNFPSPKSSLSSRPSSTGSDVSGSGVWRPW